MISIALIDDDPIEVLVIEGLLEHVSSRVTVTAFKSVEAFTKLEHPAFDLVLLDRRVPPHQSFEEGLSALNTSVYEGPVALISAGPTQELGLSASGPLHGPFNKSDLLTPEALEQFIKDIVSPA